MLSSVVASEDGAPSDGTFAAAVQLTTIGAQPNKAPTTREREPAEIESTALASAPVPTRPGLDVLLAVSIMAIVGVLVRVGTNHLAVHSSFPAFGSYYAQVVGCTIMGCTFALTTRLPPWCVFDQFALSRLSRAN